MKNYASLKLTVSALTLTALVISNAGPASAAILFQDDTFNEVQSAAIMIGSNDSGTANTAIQFGADPTPSENGNITWDITSNSFGVDHTVNVTGGLSATGAVNFSGASQMRLREAANPNATATCANTGELIVNTTSNQIMVCTTTGSPGVWTSASGTQDFESVYAADADKTLTTGGGNYTVASGNGNVSTTTGTGTFGVTSTNTTGTAINLTANTGAGGIGIGRNGRHFS